MRLIGGWVLVVLAWTLARPVPGVGQAGRGDVPVVRMGVGAFLPGRDLPARETSWGVGVGRFAPSVAVVVDYARGAERSGFAWYGQFMASAVTVDWRVGDNSLAGLTGAGVLGLQHSLGVGSAARLFVRGGVGGAWYVLRSGGACVPEDPACGLSNLYASNHLDRVVHGAGGVEVGVAGVMLSLEAGSWWSRFDAGELSARQETTTVLVGVRW